MVTNPIVVKLKFMSGLKPHHRADQLPAVFNLGRFFNRFHGLYRTLMSLPTLFWISRVALPSLLKSRRTAVDPSESCLTFTAPIVFSAPAIDSKSLVACKKPPAFSYWMTLATLKILAPSSSGPNSGSTAMATLPVLQFPAPHSAIAIAIGATIQPKALKPAAAKF